MKKIETLTLCAIFLFSVLLSATQSTKLAAAKGELRTVIFSEDKAPGEDRGKKILIASSPVLNNDGDVAFWARYTDEVSEYGEVGIWTKARGQSLKQVAGEFQQAPGLADGIQVGVPGPIYVDWRSPVLNGIGQTAFFTERYGNSYADSIDQMLWNGGDGEDLTLVARIGTQAPGVESGVSFSTFMNRYRFNPVELNDVGKVAFRGKIAGAGVDENNDSGIWHGDAKEGLGLVARTGNRPQDTNINARFTYLDDPLLNDLDQIAFQGWFAGDGSDENNGSGIWITGQDGTPELLAISGDKAPGIEGDVNFSALGLVGLNNSGEVLVRGGLTGVGVDDSNRGGVWSGGKEGLRMVARYGEQAPGVTAGVKFSVFNSLMLNDAGEAAFFGILSGPEVSYLRQNDVGIWSEGGGDGLRLVARLGDRVPGMEEEVYFSTHVFSAPVLNDLGQTAFLSTIIGEGVDLTNWIGIWAEDLDGELQLIVRTGDQIDVDDDPEIEDIRTIQSLNFAPEGRYSGDLRPRSTGFNDRGQLLFSASFTDGTSGVFVSNLVAVPEPTSILLCVFAAGASFFTRPRHLDRTI